MKRVNSLLRRLFGVISISLFLVILGCDNGTTSDVYGGQPIICFGDSITAGYGTSKAQEAYPAILGKKVKATVINAGKTGDKTTDALARVTADVVEKDPQLVIIMIGANDVFGKGSVSAATDGIPEIQANLRRIIDAVKTNNPKIYLANQFGSKTMRPADASGILGALKLFKDWEKDDTVDGFYELFMKYRQMLKDLAMENEIDFIDDIWTGILNQVQYMSDPAHPNAEGYKIMADKIFNAIEPYLKEKDLIR